MIHNFQVHVHGEVAYVSQNAWIQTGTIRENILFGSTKDQIRYQEVLKRCSLLKDIDLLPFGDLTEIGERGVNISGGQKQRVSIARALVRKPEILILDEPTSGLDPKGREQILALIKNYREKTGKTVIIVSHSMEDVARFATKVIVMNDSKVEMTGTVDEVFEHASRLREIGLSVPQITEIFIKLREKGYNVSEKISTVEQGYLELKKLVEGRGIS